MNRTGCWTTLLVCVALNAAAAPAPSSPEPFRLASTVAAAQSNLLRAAVEPTGLSREDYLKVIAGIVNYFRQFQTNDGRIIDPFLHKEVQYSTPCYAWAAAALVTGGHDRSLVDSAALALDSSFKQLAEGEAADGHGDFFTFPAMLAYEALRPRVPAQRRDRWETWLRRIEPGKAYRDVLNEKRKTVHNWNVVALAGEFLRSQNGFTDLSFVERHLAAQWQYFTPEGLYRDPNVPMAYDHFPRHFLAAILQRGYRGTHRTRLEETLEHAAWTSLLMQSPLGELPTGGRSAQHQWNEAQQCVTYEIWAARKLAANDASAARAFKRAAHLSLQSIRRWVRPSGELWIVKNRLEPSTRHGFESYSSHSQYNLLAASMLATAWAMANDTILEGACPADVGGFAFALPEFHKVIANAGGLYAEIETAADRHYNSTGLMRVHKRGVNGLVGPSDNAPAEQQPLAIGVAWRAGNAWQRLAALNPRTSFNLIHAAPNDIQFMVRYEIGATNVRAVVEKYQLTPDELRVAVEVEGTATSLLVTFPAFVFDGLNRTRVDIKKETATVSLGENRQVFTVLFPTGAALAAAGKQVRSRNGFLQEISAEIPGRRVTYALRPEHKPGPR